MNDRHIRQVLQYKTIGIAGCGGLGSNAAVALARVGVGKLIVADHDTVDITNLNRQYFFLQQVGQPKCFALRDNIRMIDPSVNVVAHHIKLISENIAMIFNRCDILIEAFDAADQKNMLIETWSEIAPEKPIISGSGIAGYGNNNKITYSKSGNLHVCGDQHTEVSEDNPPLAPRVGMVAHMQANTAIDILLQQNRIPYGNNPE